MRADMASDQGIRAKVSHTLLIPRTDAIIIDFSKAFDLVPHDRLLTKVAETGVDLRVVLWIMEFLLGRSQGVKR
jgi:hypothetical protein